MNKKLILPMVIIAVVVILFLQFIVPQITTQVYHNDEIEEDTRAELQQLNKEVLESIQENRVDDFYELLSSDFEYKLKNRISPDGDYFSRIRRILSARDFQIKDEYQLVGKPIVSDKFNLEVESEIISEPLLIRFEPEGRRTYLSLIASKGGSIDHLFSILYTQKKGEWQVTSFNLRRYAYQGQNALDFYNRAQELNEESYTMVPYLYISLAEELSPPSEFLEYKIKDEQESLRKKLVNRVANELPYPIELDSIGEGIEIFRVQSHNLEEGIAAVVKYRTNVSLEEPKELEAETEELHKTIDGIFPQVTNNFDYLVYQIYSMDRSDSNYYGVIKELSPKKSD